MLIKGFSICWFRTYHLHIDNKTYAYKLYITHDCIL